MTVRRLRWQPARRRQALQERLSQELDAWLQGWSVDPAWLSLRPGIESANSAATIGWRWLRAQGKSGGLWFGARASSLEDLGSLLAKASHGDTLGLGQRVGTRALRALLTQWAGGVPAMVEIVDGQAPMPEDCDPRFGGCEWRLEGASFEARLLVDEALASHWVPVKPETSGKLLPRESALGEEIVRLQVLLDLGQATLADTHGLQVGDVLLSTTPIDGVFRLADADARSIASARLFRLRDRRALQIDASLTKRITQ